MQVKKVSEIIWDHLRILGFDGLYWPGECSCTLDDLIACGSDPSECYPGYKQDCTCGQGCDFDIGPGNHEQEKETLNPKIFGA